MVQVFRYITKTGKDVIGEWLADLDDRRARAKINVRIDRLAAGNLGDCKAIRSGVFELRIDYGPGYRVYFAKPGDSVVLLLCGGDRRRQSTDIARAIELFEDYKRRTP